MVKYEDEDEVTLRRASLRAAVFQVQTGLFLAQQQQTGCGGGMQRNLSYAQLNPPAELRESSCSASQSSRSSRLTKLRLTHLAGRASQIVPSRLSLVRGSGSNWCVRASVNEAASEAVVAQSCGIASKGERNIYEALNELLALVTQKDERQLRQRLKAHADTIMKGRGAVGETVLHMCFLCATAAHKTLATYLVDEFGKELIDAEYHGPEYHGEVALHIALVNKDVEAVRLLIGAGADTRTPRADGRFFRRREVYFGEYLLSFAAVLNLHEMVELIVAHGADVNAKDSRGNTALHMLVLDRTHSPDDTLRAAEGLGATVATADGGGAASAAAIGPSGELPAQADMYKLLVRLGAKQDILNRGLLSPLTMAAHQGKKRMFEFVLFEQRSVLWSYGPITLARYPLAEIESAGGDSAKQRYLKPKHSHAAVRAPTALRLIVEKGHTELLLLPIVQRLLEDKWIGFVKWNIAAWFAIHMGTLAAMVTHQLLVANQTADTRRLIGEGFYWLSLVGATATGLNQLSQLQGESVYEFFLGTLSLDNFVSFLFMCALYASVPFYVTASDDWANFFLALASLLGSVYCLHFLRMLRHTGHLVVMVEKMIFDVFSWFNLVLVILLGFISAYFVLYAAPLQSYLTWDDAALAAVEGHLNGSGGGGGGGGDGGASRRALARAGGSTTPTSDVTNFNNYGDTLLSLWRLTLGDIDYGVLRESDSMILAEALWIAFTLLFAVLLLNLLIAMMGFTFSRIADKAWVELQLQRAHIILEAERCVSFFPRKRPPHHVCDAAGRWWCVMEDTHSAHYEYLSPAVAPDPDRPAYQLLSGGQPDAVARAVVDVPAARKSSTTMPSLRRAESLVESVSSTLGTATGAAGAVLPPPAAANDEEDSTEQLLAQLETVCA